MYKGAVIFQDSSNLTFTNNTAMQHGGALCVHDSTSISFVGNIKLFFITTWQKMVVEHYILMTIVTLQ